MSESYAFTGGDKLQDVLKKLSKKVRNASSLSVGWPEGATYPNGTPVAQVAAIQEFGAPKRQIPPAAFFRQMINEHSGEWGDNIAKALEMFDYDAEKALELIGQRIEEQLTDSIINTDRPELSPITLMLRKMRMEDPDLIVTGKTVGIAASLVASGADYSGASTAKLNDTGVMLASIKSVVK